MSGKEPEKPGASEKALAKFFKKGKPEPVKKKAPAATGPVPNAEGWLEEPAEERVVLGKSALEKAKDYLLAIWKSVYESAKSYPMALSHLEAELGRERSVKIPSSWKSKTYPIPDKHTAVLESTETFFILRVDRPGGGELVHLSIPRNPATKEIHFTTPPTFHYYFPYDDFKRIGGGRKTRRRLSKQKRTRRVVRRLIRA